MLVRNRSLGAEAHPLRYVLLKTVVKFIFLFLAMKADGSSAEGISDTNTGRLISPAGIAKEQSPRKASTNHVVQYGEMSFYGPKSKWGPRFYGRRKAFGQIYHESDFHVAHKTLPRGTIVRVTNLKNGKSVEAPVEDRGPYKPGRIIDASGKVAEKLGFSGVVPVRVEVIHLAAAKK